MGTWLALYVALLLASTVLQTSGSSYSHGIYHRKSAKLSATTPEPITATDQQHLDLFNYVIQLIAQHDAAMAEYGVIKPLQYNSSFVKLRTSDLQATGFTFYEFVIPAGVTVSPAVPELILVYNRFSQDGNPFSSVEGTTVSPVVDLTSFASPSNGTVVTITSPANDAFTVKFTSGELTSSDESTQCWNAPTGASTASEVVVSTRLAAVECVGNSLGTYFVLLPPPTAPPPPEASPSPVPTESASPPPPAATPTEKVSSSSDKTPVVIGATLGVIVSFALLAILLLWGYRWWHRKKIAKMEQESERGETLQTALMFGGSRAPAAGAMRTKPRLEDASVMEDAFLNKGIGR